MLLEKAVAPHSSTFAWKIPWTEEPGRLQSMGSLESGTTERLHFHFSLSCIEEGNGNPLPCSCLETPRDGHNSGEPDMFPVLHGIYSLVGGPISELSRVLLGQFKGTWG